MGALFELLAELIVAITVAALAQFGVSFDGGARSEQPAIERTLLRTAPHASAAALADEDCDEARELQSA